MSRTQVLEARLRRQIASLGGKAARDKQILHKNHVALWLEVIDGVEALFRRIRSESGDFALTFLLGDVCVMRTDNKDYLRIVVLHPDALIGVYNRSSTKRQVLEDIKEIPALALAQRKAA